VTGDAVEKKSRGLWVKFQGEVFTSLGLELPLRDTIAMPVEELVKKEKKIADIF